MRSLALLTSAILPTALVVGLVGAVVVASPARAAGDDALTAAQRAYADVDYPKCKDDATRALQGPGDKSARVDAYRLLGLCEAALGDTEKARDAFKHMLAVDKDARLPDGLSPRFTSTYREAKGSFVTGLPLTLTVDKEVVDGGIRDVRLKLTDDLELVTKIAWKGAQGSSGPPLKAAPMMELELPASTDVTVTALDAAGGEVSILFLPAKKTGPDNPPPPPPSTGPDQPFPWGVVGGVAVGAIVLAGAGVGAYFLFAPPTAVTLKTDVAFGSK